MVVGVTARLWPLYAWQRTFAATGYRQPPGSPHGLADPRLRWIVLAGWSLAVPLILMGILGQLATAIEAAGLFLVAAVVVGAIDGFQTLAESKISP